MIRTWLTTNALYIALAALAGVSAFAGWQTLQLANARAAVQAAEAKTAKLEAAVATAGQKAEAYARAAEATKNEKQRGIDAAYAKGQADAKDAADRTVADLNAGALKLRQQWAGCETSRLSEAAQTAAGADDRTRLQRESAGRIVRAVDECQAQVTALQASLKVCSE